jgi:predicted Rossmann fold flavoprotein
MDDPAPRHADLLVVGAGAAGLMAAITAGRLGAGRVVVLEGAARLGAKILISGGGRCNVTNARVEARDFSGGPRRAIERVLRAFPVASTVAFFEELGVRLHEEPRGKLFPDTGRARTVLGALLEAARLARVEVVPACRVTSASPGARGFDVHTSTGRWHAGRLVLATGGLSLPKTGSDGHGLPLARALGHRLVDTTPALVPLVLGPGGFHTRLSGVALEVELVAAVEGRVTARLAGPLLWTHLGVSGPAALDASRHWHRAMLEDRGVALTANLCGGRTFDEADRVLATGGRQSVRAALEVWMPASLAAEVLSLAPVDPALPLAQLPREVRRRLSHLVTALPLDVIGSRGYTHAEATAGGVALDGVDTATMASRCCAGLYLAGEMLDVDGRLGGFNFQWAWSSGFVAGRAAAISLRNEERGMRSQG